MLEGSQRQRFRIQTGRDSTYNAAVTAHFIDLAETTPAALALHEALARNLVITPNRRLRRELARAWLADFQMGALQAAPLPVITTLPEFLLELFNQARFATPSLPAVASAESLHRLAYETAPEGHAHLTAEFLDAVRQCWAYEIEPTTPSRQATEFGRLGAVWERRLIDALTDRGLAAAEQLPSRFADVLLRTLVNGPVPGADAGLLLVAFEQLPPPIENLLAGAAAASVRIERLPLALAERGNEVRVVARDAAEELNLAAQWCRSTLAADPEARIGVVLPDLTTRHAAARRQFAAVLAPGAASRQTGLFDLAGGTALRDEPVWQSAATLLRWCQSPLTSAEIEPLLASPHLPVLPDTPLDAALPSAFDLALYAYRQPSDPALRSLAASLDSLRGSRTLEHWIVQFEELLELAGWPGTGLGSVQFQVVERLRENLERLRCAAGDRPLGCAAALDIIDQWLARQPFAPEQPSAPILILGPLETTGLRFTHLWVTGLSEDLWPAAVSGNAFLPARTRREFALPRADNEAERVFARQRLAHWRAAADVLMLSRPATAGDTELEPSPLLPATPEIAAEALLPDWQARSHPLFQSEPVERLPVAPDQVNPLPPGELNGGTGLLRDLADCPFRAWARHRAGLRPAEPPHSFPSARDRGILVHRALQRLALAAPGRNATSRLDANHAVRLAERVVAEQFSRFPDRYRAHESQRLARLLEAWIAFERTRADYELVDVEYDSELAVGTYRLRMRVDRADRVAGELIVIDYKTGKINANNLLHDDLPEPQLPAYACANPAVAGVFFAALSTEAVTFAGVADTSLELPEARLVNLPEGGFAALRAQWQARVTDLVERYVSGDASVQPRAPSVCQYCELQPLCRVRLGDSP